MAESITLSKASLYRLLDFGMPGRDDPGDPDNPWGPFGPAGPVSEEILSRLSSVLLNPQPLPPRFSSNTLRHGPHPDPWRSASVVRTVIQQTAEQLQMAEVIASPDQSERSLEAIRGHIREFVDDYCGNGPRRIPLPRPWPPSFDPAQLDPIDLLVAGAQFQKVADTLPNSPLVADFSRAADQLFEVAASRMQDG